MKTPDYMSCQLCSHKTRKPNSHGTQLPTIRKHLFDLPYIWFLEIWEKENKEKKMEGKKKLKENKK